MTTKQNCAETQLVERQEGHIACNTDPSIYKVFRT